MANDIFYMRDPKKNNLCTKKSCYYNPLGMPRECRMTTNRECAVNGTRYRFDEKTGEWFPIPLDLGTPHAMTPDEIVNACLDKALKSLESEEKEDK